MSVCKITYYQIMCDEPGCTVSTATLGGEYNYTAWATPEVAEADWGNSEGFTIGERHYCLDHRTVHECAECGWTSHVTVVNGKYVVARRTACLIPGGHPSCGAARSADVN
jgi:hypothetical protein